MTAPFAFAGSGLDRAGQARLSPDLLAAQEAGATAIRLIHGEPLVAPDGESLARGPLPSDGLRLFLGVDADGPVWAVEAEGEPGPDLRSLIAVLPPRDGELAATARAVLGWHRRHRFCANCGAPTETAAAGWRRDCAACGTEHYPRTDPVVIMLVTCGSRALFGRSPGWPPGMISTLAGFVEPGETVEAAVAREVQEEAGVRVGRVRYLASQPWPFPSSLMLGCVAEADDDALTVDPAELEWAGWMTRERMLAVVAGRDPEFRAPRRGAIAAWLVGEWLAGRA